MQVSCFHPRFLQICYTICYTAEVSRNWLLRYEFIQLLR